MTAFRPDGVVGAAPASELKLRVGSGLVLGAVALLTAWTGGWLLAALWLAAGGAVALEWLAMTRSRPEWPISAVMLAGLAVAEIASLAGSGLIATAALALAALAIVALAAGTRDRLWGLAGLGYAAAIALVPVAVHRHPDGGASAILWMFAVVWTTDVVAYFAGRALGGPKLWRAVSPKKTWSGFAGGLFGGTAAGAAVALVAGRAGVSLPAGLVAIAIASAAASLASQAGDLFESAMKRRFGVKDSGRIIPGHGGAMDRLDGFAAVAILIGLGMAVSSAVGWAARP